MEDKTYRLSLKLSDGTTQSADFTIPGDDAVLYTAQTLTDEQKAQARENIGVMSADTTQSKLDEKITNPATAQVGQVIAVKAVDADGKPTDWEAVDMSGGVSSWNDLTDKPVVIEGGDTLTWDGNTEGLVSVMDAFFKVSDAVPSYEELLNATLQLTQDGETLIFTPDVIAQAGFLTQIADGIWTISNIVYFVANEAVGVDLGGASFPASGTYFINEGNMPDDFCISITITDYTGFEKEVLDPEFLPSRLNVLYTDGTYLYNSDNTTDESNRTTLAQLKGYFNSGQPIYLCEYGDSVYRYSVLSVALADSDDFGAGLYYQENTTKAYFTAEYTAE